MSENSAEVSIDTPPLTVTVKGQGSVRELSIEALALYRAVWRPDMGRVGSPVGFVTERDLGAQG